VERKTLYHNREVAVSLLVSPHHVILDVIRPRDFFPELRSVLNDVTEVSGWLVVIYGLNRTCKIVRLVQSRQLILPSRLREHSLSTLIWPGDTIYQQKLVCQGTLSSYLLKLRSRCYHWQVTNAQHILRYSGVPDSPVVQDTLSKVSIR
jgi:hypothetical protein